MIFKINCSGKKKDFHKVKAKKVYFKKKKEKKGYQPNQSVSNIQLIKCDCKIFKFQKEKKNNLYYIKRF